MAGELAQAATRLNSAADRAQNQISSLLAGVISTAEEIDRTVLAVFAGMQDTPTAELLHSYAVHVADAARQNQTHNMKLAQLLREAAQSLGRN